MCSMDPFGRTDELGDALLDALVVRFEARGENPLFSKMLEEYLVALNIDIAGNVLEIGCGTGLVARAIARRPGFSGRVIGVDLSSHLVAAAERLAHEEGLDERLEFRTGDARNLNEVDGTFDAVVAHTLLSHVEDPFTVLTESARVLRTGGMLGVFDGDYASLTFGHADPVKGRSYDETMVNALVTNPRIMRQLPRLLRQAGLELVTCFPYVLSEVGTADFWLSAVEAYRKLLPRSGVMSKQEADAWATALRTDSEQGIFFGSSNYYGYVARCR